MSAVAPALDTAAVWIFKHIVDDVLVPRALRALVPLAAALSAVAVMHGLAGYGERVLSARTAQGFLLRLRRRAFAHLIGARLDSLDRQRLGDLLGRLGGDAALIESFLVSGLATAISDLARMVFFTGALFALSWRLALIALAAAPMSAWLTRRVSRRLRTVSRHARDRSGAALTVVEEALSTALVVKAFGRESWEVDRFCAEAQGGADAQIRAARLQGLLSPVVDIAELAAGLSVVAFGALELGHGRISLGGLLVFVTYIGKLYSPVRGLGGYVASAHTAAAGAERIAEIFDAPVAPEPPPKSRPPRVRRKRLVFEEVSFRYRGATSDTLRSVSFELDRGELLALVGPNGVGKSTIIKLALRLLEPTGGRILVDGVDVKDLPSAALRARFALVPQDAGLFHSSMRDNIAYGREGASDEDVERAARAAHAHGFIMALPEGYATLAGDKGRRLSGGQRQRIAVARALVRDAPILLLDEPTSGLDASSTRMILASLRRSARDRACLLISHDPRALGAATRVLALQDGGLVEGPSPAIASSTTVPPAAAPEELSHVP
jgi:ABC-type multidrug transport system fused ATPase/permease subunit